MEQEKNGKGNDSILAFDTLYTTNSIQILKILLPCFPAGSRQALAVLIKYLELQYVIELSKVHPVSCGGRQTENQMQDFLSVYPRLKGYLSPTQQQQMEQILQIGQAIRLFQEYRPILEKMQELSAQAGDGNDPGALFACLAGLWKPDTQAQGAASDAAAFFRAAGGSGRQEDKRETDAAGCSGNARKTDADGNAERGREADADGSTEREQKADADGRAGSAREADTAGNAGSGRKTAAGFSALPGMELLKSMLSPEQQAMFERFCAEP